MPVVLESRDILTSGLSDFGSPTFGLLETTH